MAESNPPDVNPADVDDSTVVAFADHLEAFANTLSDRERDILGSMLYSVLDPWERMRLRDPDDMLSPSEAEILRAIESEQQG